MLVDCGEGTQRQLLRSTIGLIELPEVFLTHYHADHYLGLPGMLKTFALRSRELPLTVYGPPGLRDLFGALQRIFGKLSYPVELVELRDGDVVDRGDYRIVPFKVAHGVTANGYAFVELPRPGRFDVETARSLGVPEGPLFGRLQAGETVELPDGGEVRPEQVLGPAAARAQDRLRRRHGARGERPRGREGRRRPRPRGDLRRGGARARRRDGALDRGRRGRARGCRRRPHARADAPLQPVLRARDRAGGTRGLPRDSGPEGLRYHRRPVPGAGRPPTRQGRRESDARGGRAA